MHIHQAKMVLTIEENLMGKIVIQRLLFEHSISITSGVDIVVGQSASVVVLAEFRKDGYANAKAKYGIMCRKIGPNAVRAV